MKCFNWNDCNCVRVCLKDDYRISLRYEIITKDMAPMCPVDMSGRFTDPVSDFKGQYVKVFTDCVGYSTCYSDCWIFTVQHNVACSVLSCCLISVQRVCCCSNTVWSWASDVKASATTLSIIVLCSFFSGFVRYFLVWHFPPLQWDIEH